MDDLRQLGESLDHEVVLGRRTRDAESVRFLERVATDQLVDT